MQKGDFMQKKKLMIDMDEVITGENLTPMIETFLGYSIDLSQTGYYIQNVLGERKKEFFEKVFPYQNLYEKAELKEGCRDTLLKLNEQYEIYIVTAYLWPDALSSTGNILKYKFDFLIKKLPFLQPNNFIFINDKSMIHFDIKIDDRIQNLQNTDIKLLFDSYHNKNITNEELEERSIKRVMNWKEIEQILLNRV